MRQALLRFGAGYAALFLACGPASVPPANPCRDVTCNPGFTCEVTTGQCVQTGAGGGMGTGGGANTAGGNTAGGLGGGTAGGDAGGLAGGGAGGVAGGATAGGSAGGAAGGATAGGTAGGSAGGAAGGATAGGTAGGSAGGVAGGATAGGTAGGSAGGAAGGATAGGTAGGSAGGAAGGVAGGSGLPGDTCFNAQTVNIPLGSTLSFQVDPTPAMDDYDGTCNTAGRGRELVFHIPLPQPQNVSITATRSAGSSANPVIYVRGSPCFGGTELGCSDDPGSAAATEFITLLNRSGDVYLFVENYGTSTGSIDVTVRLDMPSVPPPNDECERATVLNFTATGDGGTLATAAGDTTLATNSGMLSDPSPSCSASARQTGRDVVYALTLSAWSHVIVNLFPAPGAAYSPVFYLRRNMCSSTALADQLTCQAATMNGQALSAVVPTLAPGTYHLWVDGAFSSFGRFDLEVRTVPAIPPPPNDTCATAQPLAFVGGVAMVSSDTTLATNDNLPTDPTPSCSTTVRQDGQDLVYSYTLTAPSDVDFTVTPTPAGAGTLAPVIYVRRNMCTSTLPADEALCQSQFTPGQPVSGTLINQPAGTYHLWVDSAVQTVGTFDLRVQVNPAPPPPPNDACTGAEVLSFVGGVANASGSTAGANNSNSPTDPAPTCSPGAADLGFDVVYEFTTTALQDVTVRVTPTGTQPLVPVFYLRSQAQCASGAINDELACATSSTAVPVQTVLRRLPAGTYVVWVDSATVAGRGSFDLSVALQPPTPPPANDVCATATAITGWDLANPTFTLTDSTQVASNDNAAGPNPTCSAGARTTGRDVFFTYTLDGGAPVPVTLAVSPLSSHRSVLYVESACGATQLGCNAATQPTHLSGVTLMQGAGTYTVGVDSDNVGGDFRIDGRIGAPPNDTCATARPILLSTLTQDNSIVDTNRLSVNDYSSTTSPPYPPPCTTFSEAGPDVVYAYTHVGAARSVTARVTPQSGFDVGLLRLEGSCAPASCVALDDSGAGGVTEELTWTAQTGVTYWLVVDGFSGTSVGVFRVWVE